jgi:hypothetical protein
MVACLVIIIIVAILVLLSEKTEASMLLARLQEGTLEGGTILAY